MTDKPKGVFATAYTLTLEQIAKVSDLANKLGKNKSEVVREAIDEYYASQEKQENSDKQPG